jgi:hypothetical protein
MSQTQYMVVHGDVESSREQVDRRLVQLRLESAVATANAWLGSAVLVPLSITGGDSVQALVATPSRGRQVLHALDYCLAAQIEHDGVETAPPLADAPTNLPPARRGAFLPPLRLRHGLGWGELWTDFRDTTSSMDGPCFHAASAALDDARRRETWLAAQGFGPEMDAIVNVAADLLSTIRGFWSATQHRAVAFHHVHATQRLAALALGVNDSTLSRALRAARHHEFARAETAVFAFLDRLVQGEPR